MTRIALIRNLASTRNRSGSADAPPPGIKLIDSFTLDRLGSALAETHAEGIDVLVVDGGDGTVREVLSRVPEIWGARLPRMGIVPRGNTNLMARHLGVIDSYAGLAELARRLETGQPLTERTLKMLRIDYPGGEHPPVRGSIAGWGVYVDATRISRRENPALGSTGVALAVFKMLFQGLVGGERSTLRQGVRADLIMDGIPRGEGNRVIGVMTTLQRTLTAHLNPFWGDGSGNIRWLDIKAPAARLAQATPYILRGRPARWMAAAGYHSGRAARIELSLDTPLIIDGELYPAPVSGPLLISAEEEITFVSL